MMTAQHWTIMAVASAVSLGLVACGGNGHRTSMGGGDGSMPMQDGGVMGSGLPVLGAGSHSIDGVQLEPILDNEDGLEVPRDVAFNPKSPQQLWVVNEADSSMVIHETGGEGQNEPLKALGPGHTHFLARPAALAFGANGNFATAQEEDEKTQRSTPADFMGPTLWSSDLDIFDGGHGGHLDMLHNSPNSAGIAWEKGNAYWVFDGYHNAITRYDFVEDHGPGGSDHSDGEVARYVEGEVEYVSGVPSHLAMDHEEGLLYIADTGNNRIARLDTSTGERGDNIRPNYDGSDQYAVEGAEIETFVDGSEAGLEQPSGLALHDGHVFVTDNATSQVLAFDLEGRKVDWLDLADEVDEGGLIGLTFDSEGRLLVVDSAGNRVLRIAPVQDDTESAEG